MLQGYKTSTNNSLMNPIVFSKDDCLEPYLWYMDTGWTLLCETRRDFIVLPYWKNRHDDRISHSVTLPWHWANQSLSYPKNAGLLARKWQILIFKSLVWLIQDSNPWGSDPPISQNASQMLNSFGHLLMNMYITSSKILNQIQCSSYPSRTFWTKSLPLKMYMPSNHIKN